MVTGKQKGPLIFVGYGAHDGLVGQDSVLAAALPKDHVLRVPGAHEWKPWRAVLEQFLQRSEFRRRCAP